MKLESIVQLLGGSGVYQRRLCVMVCLVAIPDAWHVLSGVFLTATPDHWCSVPSGPELFNCSQLNYSDPQCVEQKKTLFIPHEVDNKSSLVVYEKCSRYIYNISEMHFYNATLHFENALLQRETVGCGDLGMDYDHSQYESTATEEFDLVCDRQNLPSYANSIFFTGILIGSVFFGTLSDWIGRYPTFFICVGAEAIIGIIAAFSPNFATFVAMRFFIGMTNLGAYMVAFVLGTELVGAEYRALAGTILLLFYSIGYMSLSVLAYFIRDWRTLQLVISAPLVLFLLLIPFISESVRWLMSKGKYAKAEKIIRKAAKVNKVQLPDVLFDENEIALGKNMESAPGRRPTQLDLFRTPKMRMNTINIMYNWFVNNLVYYGLSLNTSSLGVNDYVAAFVSGAVEIPAYLSCWFIIQRVGRRLPLCLYMVIGGAACLLTIFVPTGVYRTIVAMIGKFCISASFGLAYIISAEIYPTVVRSIGMGISSMSARASGVLSPMIILLGNYWAPLPPILFGVNSILAGVFALLLPETLGKELPQTLTDGEQYPNDGVFPCLQRSNNEYQHPPDTDEKTDVKEDECHV